MYKAAAAISVFLFLTGFWICKWAYPNAFLPVGHPLKQQGLDDFTDLRYNIYAILIGLMFFAYLKETKNEYVRSIMVFGMGLSGSDLMDRFISGITKFTEADKFLIPFSFILAIYVHVKRRKKAVQ